MIADLKRRVREVEDLNPVSGSCQVQPILAGVVKRVRDLAAEG